MKSTKIGFVGVGRMGANMARRLKEVGYPVVAVFDSHSGIAIELAKELGCSRKHLTLRFRHEFGVSPKLLARILRFDRAVRLIGAGRVAGLADLAAASGYADQAHLSREFRIFTGSAPTAFLCRRLPDEGGFRD